MKLTQSQLKKIIIEEMKRSLGENKEEYPEEEGLEPQHAEFLQNLSASLEKLNFAVQAVNDLFEEQSFQPEDIFPDTGRDKIGKKRGLDVDVDMEVLKLRKAVALFVKKISGEYRLEDSNIDFYHDLRR